MASAHQTWITRRVLVIAGGVTAVIGAGGPFANASERSLVAHMSEHVLLLLVAPLLLALGAPAAFLRRRVADGGPRWLAAVGVAFASHAAAMIVWHLPGPFDAAVRVEWLHAFEHLTMAGTGYVFWVVILSGDTARAAVVPVLFVASLPGTALGLAMTLATTSWYSGYPAVGGQQLAGVVMWAGGGLVYTVVGAAAFGAWLHAASAPPIAAVAA